MALLPKDVLTTATHELIGADPATLSSDRLQYLITLTQHATDLLLNEIERRGELTWTDDGFPIVPYISDHMVETVLTSSGPHG